MSKTGRPRVEIDKVEFEKLCALQCTIDEVCAWFDISRKTLESWCKRTYNGSFSTVFEQKRVTGKISLRRAQFQLAQKNASMAIFLGKNYLGQSDKVDVQMQQLHDIEVDPLSKALSDADRETS